MDKPLIEVIEIEEVHREIKDFKNHKALDISGLIRLLPISHIIGNHAIS